MGHMPSILGMVQYRRFTPVPSILFQVRNNFFVTRMLLLITRPLQRDGGMADDHGAPEAGKLLRVWTRGRRVTESRQRVRSWTVQNEMRDVVGRVSAGAAGRILDSANPREIRT